MLAPLLAFTADEAWEFVSGKTADSAHQLFWQPMKFERPDTERKIWTTLFGLRELALPALEKARQAKAIGKALEAKLIFAGDTPELQEAVQHLEALRELLNVSQLEIKAGPGKEVGISVEKASGQKCERCWHWETDVGSNAEHPTICARCVKAVTQVGQ
jgi:isoleucyl-tRNA synthetase